MNEHAPIPIRRTGVSCRRVGTLPFRLARFQREAEAVAALTHPNIVTIYSIEEEAGVTFLTMELVDGQSLDHLIPPEGLPLVHVLDIGLALADALVASHEVGIVHHRDLKPANVMLAGRERRVKVLDFGLAKLRGEGAPLEGETRTAAITGEGKVLGTVAYMSPEQAQGKPVDARSDLFSLGVMLYELATGERPFKGDTSLSVLSAILKDTPKSVTGLRPDLPREFGRIVKRCLQKDTEERYQTAKDVRADLKALRAEVESGESEARPAASSGTRTAAAATPERASAEHISGTRDSAAGTSAAVALDLGTPRRRVRRWAIGLVALLTFITALAFVAWRFGRTPDAPPPRPFESISLRRLTTQGNVETAAISPDGKYVAYVADEAVITVTSFEGGEPEATYHVPRGTGGSLNKPSLRWTPDGRALSYVATARGTSNIWVQPIAGGAPRQLTNFSDGTIWAHSWAADGRLALARGRVNEDIVLITSEGRK